MYKLLAVSVPLGNIGGLGEIGNTQTADPIGNFTLVVSTIIGVFTVIGILYFMFQLFIGAIGWISSGSDKQAMDNTKKRLTHAFIGLLMVVVSYTLVAIVGAIVGIDIINLKGIITNIALHP